MQCLLLVSFLTAYVWAQVNETSVDELIENVFSPKNETTQSPVETSTVRKKTRERESCTWRGKVGICVHYYLCKNHTIITNGIGIVDIRARRRRRQTAANEKDDALEENVLWSQNPTTVIPRDEDDADFEETRPLSFVRDRQCRSYVDECCFLPKKSQRPSVTNTQFQRKGCGWRNPDGVGYFYRRQSEDEAQFGEFPWMVIIAKYEDAGNVGGQNLSVFVGGGSIIHPSVVLTSANIATSNKKFRLRAGGISPNKFENDLYPQQDRVVAEIKVHDEFDRGSLYNDVALLFVSDPFELAPNVGVVCLPDSLAKPVAKTRCLASGWGKDKFGRKGKYQTRLKIVELTMITQKNCEDQLHETRLGPFFELHWSFICASGGAGRDTCKGDGGSPLVCPLEDQSNRYQQYGIVSWGIGCGEYDVPGVYADVGQTRDWIDAAVRAKGYDPAVYSIIKYEPQPS